jgi:hypothetical protein
MNKSIKLLNELVSREGFVHLPAYELFAASPIIDVVTEKLSSLDPGDFAQQQLAASARLLTDALRETLARRYTGLSVIAFARILVALDHLVRSRDELSDTLEGGYADDIKAITSVMKDYEAELTAFKRWRMKTGQRW